MCCTALQFQKEKLGKETDGIKHGAQGETLQAVSKKFFPNKADIPPLFSEEMQDKEKQKNAENFVDKTLGKNGFIRADKKDFRRMRKQADAEKNRAVQNTIFG